MKISYNWLNELISTDKTPEQLNDLLTNCGLEVENIEPYQNIKGGLQGILVGEVKKCSQHPNADRLKLTKVDIASGELLSIVCGAPNVAVGQKVLVATVGATLFPTKGDSFTIKQSKIRGELSEGMLCAEDELGIGESHDGIIVLPPHYEIGKQASAYFSVYTDTLIEIGLTANRGDAASHLGVARDLKALTGNQISRFESGFNIPEATENVKIDVVIEDLKGCGRYSGIVIKDIEVKPSPDWIQNRLRVIGLTPINNIVDATNYVLHELGQPLHAFDLNRIKGSKIIVKQLAEGSTFVTLDKSERKLDGTECMICDSENALAIAGVYGGLHSGVTAETKDIFIESAYFSPASIRKTAKAHGLSTDASFRYERGTDPNITIDALKRVVQIILEIAGGKVASEVVDVYPTPIKPVQLNFRLAQFYRLIGQHIPKDDIKRILNTLEIEWLNESEDAMLLSIPPYRSDVTREADVAEEILRIYGLNQIAIPSQLKSTLTHSQDEKNWMLKNKVANFLSNNGFVEMLSNSLTKSQYYTTDELKQAVRLLNPLSADLDVMRLSLVYNGLEMIQYNKNRRLQDIRAYEFGYVYNQDESGYHQFPMLAIFITGKKQPENWQLAQQDTTIFELKMYVERVMQLAGVAVPVWKYDSQHDQLDHYTELWHEDKLLGGIGIIKEKLASKFDINQPVYSALLNWNAFTSIKSNTTFELQDVSPFPSVRRDLALLLDKGVNYKQIEELVKRGNDRLIKEVNIFDIYEGDKIDKDKKSYTISLIIQHDEKTMTDEETDAVVKKVLKELQKHVAAELRT